MQTLPGDLRTQYQQLMTCLERAVALAREGKLPGRAEAETWADVVQKARGAALLPGERAHFWTILARADDTGDLGYD